MAPRSFSPSALSNHLGCAHTTILERALATGRIAKPSGYDPTRDLRVARGLRHEHAYVDSLRAEGLTVEDLDGKSVDATRDAMARGVDAIVQAELAHTDDAGQWRGRADVLRKVPIHDGPTPPWGAWAYEVHDTKLATETRGGTLLQLALYSEWLFALQGVRPQRLHVVMPGEPFDVESVRLADVDAYTRWALARFREAAAREPTDEEIAAAPDPRPHCEICRWWKDCDTRRSEADHLSLVAGISRAQIRVLRDADLATMTALATGRDRVPLRPEHGAHESYLRLHHQARVQHASRGLDVPRHELLDTPDNEGLGELPLPRPGDLFLDFEGCPFVAPSGREYLFGLAWHDGGEDRYSHRWAWTAAEEREAFGWLLDTIRGRLADDPEIHVYHFGAYEGTALRQLASRYGERMDDVDALLRGRVLVDLHAIVRRAAIVGVASYSIKMLEPLYGLRREAELPEARVALRRVEAALELGVDPATLGEDAIAWVRRYNRDDCVSVRALRDWLEGQRSVREAATGRVLPRPGKPSEAPNEELDARNQALAELASRLRDGVADDASERSDEQKARWLLADLLSYHRREHNATWWEFYRLAALDEDDALEDRDALVGVVVERTFDDPNPKARSKIRHCRLPRQDTAMKAGDVVHAQNARGAEEPARRFATVHAIDRNAGWVELRATAKAWPVEDAAPRILFRHTSFDAKGKAAALGELARSVLDDRDDPTWRAARELLMRAPPRLRQGSLTTPIEVVAALDHTVLAIQGPPGTGKTHNGAEMILRACELGLRVGVTAGSHAAIRNALEKVIEVGTTRGKTPSLAHKTEDDDDDPDDGIAQVSDPKKIAGLLAARTYDAIGGTTFLWCREDLRDSLDVLFVDEAGQLSLADTLAVAGAAKSLVLLGDPQQLQQPRKASHPDGADVSALRHLLGDAHTIATDRGFFLGTTWRLPPAICDFTSHVFYDARLAGLEKLQQRALLGSTRFAGHGLFRVDVPHHGCSIRAPDEVAAIVRIVTELLDGSVQWRDMEGEIATLTASDILVVAPYNGQVDDLAVALRPLGVEKVGTVDRFQGQQAPVVLWSMTSSTPEDAPRGLGFLYDGFRLNVATSRAKVACIVVGSPSVFDVDCRTADDVRLVNRWCVLAERSTRVP